MAEGPQWKAYEYRTNSSVVLQSARRHKSSSDATGEPETLVGRISHRMGDLYKTSHLDHPKSVEKLDFKEVKIGSNHFKSIPSTHHHLSKPLSIHSVLENDILEGIKYQPRLKETRAAYEHLLKFVQHHLGDQQLEVVMSASDELLAILKDANLRPSDRQHDMESLLGPLPSIKWTELYNISDQITDYLEATAAISTTDDDAGVAVLIGNENEEEEDEDDDEIEIDGEKMDFLEDLKVNDFKHHDLDPSLGHLKDDIKDDDIQIGQKIENQPNQGQDEWVNRSQHGMLDPRNIDAYWLQRSVNEFIKDAEQSAKLSMEILGSLNKPDDREVENDLLDILDYDRFDFIKMLLHNRMSIYYATRLRQAQTDEERDKIKMDMKLDPSATQVLNRLQVQGISQSLDFRNKLQSQQWIKEKINDQGSCLVQNHPNSTILSSNSISSSSISSSSNSTSIYAYDHRVCHALDLTALSFQGNHVMTNRKCILPQGTKRVSNREYEEILVPGIKSLPSDDDEAYPIDKFPDWAQLAFQNIKTLNPIQSKCRNIAFETHENILLCAPTGAGKTNVAMMCILHEIGLHIIDREKGIIDLDAFKIVYIAPMKSLVQEIVFNFSTRLASLGIIVKELSGDAILTKKQIGETQLIVTTPEKWDIITRKSGDRTYTQLVKLIIIDEIHLLHDERGPVIESIVARTMRQIETTRQMIRFVGLSATLPNVQDVATFLRVQSGLFTFKNHHRPIPLEQWFIGINVKKPFKRFQVMNEICYEKMMAMAGEQILIFVHSRKETVKMARLLRDMAIERQTLSQIMMDRNLSTKEILKESAEQARNMDLRDLLPYGFAIHHAGMAKMDRTLVEDLFSDHRIQVLVSTATLAWGVNLPAHGVIIKGTQIYNPEKGKWTELSPLDIMQMLGRAGRPQYDTKGIGVVITTHQELQYYLSLLNQQLPIESQFIKKLVDSLNAEIVLGTIETISQAVQWLEYTYLYVCMLRNPDLYGISPELNHDNNSKDPYLEQRRYDLIHSAALMLAKHNMIKYDRKNGRFQATEYGKIASLYYIPHDSMVTYNEHLKSTSNDVEILRIFGLSKEFQQIAVRADERLELEKLIERVPIPIKESVDEPAAKINILLQTYISNLKLEGFSLMSDMVYVTQSASRIMRALFEMGLRKGWAQVSERCLSFCKMIDRRMWSTQSPLRQFHSIPEEVVRKLEKKELGLDRLLNLNIQEIGELVRYPSLGKTIYQHVHQFPKLDVTPTVQPITRSLLQIELIITPDFEFVEKYHGTQQLFWIFTIDVDGETILHYEPFLLKKKNADQEQFLSFTVTMFEPTPPQYFIRILSDRWLGYETIKPISFHYLIPPSRFPETRNLLDLQPLSIMALKNPTYEASFAPHFTIFNHIQTQTFNAFYNSDANILLCAPTGSGKTICAQLAIMRQWHKMEQEKEMELEKSNFNGNGKKSGVLVYLLPFEEQVPSILNRLKSAFPSKVIQELTGNTAMDIKWLDHSDLVISSVRNWDILSRRWKQRAAIQRVQLLIIDELHLISNAEIGATMEVVVSRMRYMSKQLKFSQQEVEDRGCLKDSSQRQDVEIRFVGLASCIANANHIADWLGVSSSNLFNFRPLVRPVPVEINLQGSDLSEPSARLMSMSRPLISSLSRCASDDPILIYVPSRRASKIIIRDLTRHLKSEGSANRFLNITMTALEKILEPFHLDEKNPSLAQSLAFGIGFYNESMAERERKMVKDMFDCNQIKVLVITHDVVWSMDSRARFVAILGTQYYEGKERRYIEYTISELLQMIGQAGRQGIDANSHVLILCHSPRREFYKRFISDPLPIESHLDRSLHDHINAEIYNKVIERKQEALDYLTWTFYYRRLTQNPNFYGLQGITHRHLSEHLSELLEETLNDLEEAKCIMIEDDTNVSILNAGMISAFYYIRYTTIELFNSSLTERTKIRGLIEILTNASEFEVMSVRHKEDDLIRHLAHHLSMKVDKPDYFSVPTKVNVLLQAHFSRRELPIDLLEDQKKMVSQVPELLQAMVDVISSSEWLSPAIAAMELSQMVVQAMWDTDSFFYQLPHFTPQVVERIQSMAPECQTIFDLIELEDSRRNEILQLSPRQLADVASVCNQYTNIETSYELAQSIVVAGDPVSLNVHLERELEDLESSKFVSAPYFPKKKSLNWWLVVGDVKQNILLAIKRMPLSQRLQQTKLEFNAPETAGEYNLTLYLISDSWMGCDQEYEFQLKVVASENEEMIEEGEYHREKDNEMKDDEYSATNKMQID